MLGQLHLRGPVVYMIVDDDDDDDEVVVMFE